MPYFHDYLSITYLISSVKPVKYIPNLENLPSVRFSCIELLSSARNASTYFFNGTEEVSLWLVIRSRLLNSHFYDEFADFDHVSYVNKRIRRLKDRENEVYLYSSLRLTGSKREIRETLVENHYPNPHYLRAL